MLKLYIVTFENKVFEYYLETFKLFLGIEIFSAVPMFHPRCVGFNTGYSKTAFLEIKLTDCKARKISETSNFKLHTTCSSPKIKE